MSPFPAILVPLDGSQVAARSLGCATWLASRLGSRLHVLSATSRELPARDELVRLHIPEEHWSRIELHRAPAYPEEAIVAAVGDHDARLVIMTARGESVDTPGTADMTRLVGHVAHAVIERSPVPVLLLPPAYEEVLPWERILVPLSGGAESHEALVIAVHLATALDLTVHVTHVADAELESLTAKARYSDALHHEYRARLDEIVARAILALPRDECRRVKTAALGTGDVANEVLKRVEIDRISVLVAGWHGCFSPGRARVLKELIGRARTPMLLAKPASEPSFRLTVGEAFE